MDLPYLLRLLDPLRLLGVLDLLRLLMPLERDLLLRRLGLLVLLRLRKLSGSLSLCLTLSEWAGRGGEVLLRDGTSWYCLGGVRRGGVRRGGVVAFWEGDLDLLLEELGLSPPLLLCPGFVLLLSVTSSALLLPLLCGATEGLVLSFAGLYLC